MTGSIIVGFVGLVLIILGYMVWIKKYWVL